MAETTKISSSKYNLSPDEQKLCNGIIHSASGSAAAVGAGMAQLPLADNAVITPIQIGMIISLGEIFGQSVSKTFARSLLSGFVANFVGRGIAQVAVGVIPVAGNITNAVTAATITESIGWLSVDYFYKIRYSEKESVSGKVEPSMNYEGLEGKGFAVIKKACDVVKDGEKGRLVWDYLIVNEITFMNERTGATESLYKGWDDNKTEAEFGRLASMYAPKPEIQQKALEWSDEKREQIEDLKNLAEQFIKGEKSRFQNKEEYCRCIDGFDEILDDLQETDPLRNIYSEFMDIK